MQSNSTFIRWLVQSRENIRIKKEERLVLKNAIAHKHKGFFSSSSRKVVESFVAPPSFLVYVWSTSPLLLIATFSTTAIAAGIVATIINFFLIHRDTYDVFRYITSGIVLLVVILLYYFGVV